MTDELPDITSAQVPTTQDVVAPIGDNTPDKSTDTATGGDKAVTPTPEEQAQLPRGLKPRTRDYVNEANRKKHEAEKRAQTAEAANHQLAKQLEELRAKRGEAQNPADIIRYAASDAVKEGLAEVHETNRQEALRDAQRAEQDAWNAIQEDARERYADFDAVTGNEKLPISPEMADVIREIPEGADLAYYLGKNPKEAADIYALNPRLQAVALTRLINKLPQAAAEEVRAKTSGAPAPVVALSGKQGTAKKSLEAMSYEEYKAARMGGSAS